MPVYPKGPGRWRVVVSRRGKRKDWIVGSKEQPATKADAKAFEARKMAELEAGETTLDVRTVPTLRAFTVGDNADGPYLQHAKETLSEATLRNRGYQIASLVEVLGDLRLNEIDRPAVTVFQRARRNAGVKPSTVNDDVKVLIAILNFAREERKLPVPKPNFASLPEGTRRNAEPWSDDQVAKLYGTCGKLDAEFLPILVFLFNTGCRRGEAIALRWESVDFDRGHIRIEPTERWAPEDEAWEPKDREPRLVPLNDVLRSWLKRMAEGTRSQWVFSVQGNTSRTKHGRFAFWPQRRFDFVREKAGLKGGPHKTRHTYASHFLAHTPDLFLLGRIMGHSHQRVTELYGHLLPDAMRRAAEAVSFAPALGPAEAEARRRWKGAKRGTKGEP